MIKAFTSILSGCVLLASAAAAVGEPQNDASLEQIKEAISAGLQAGQPGIQVSNVEESPIPGLYKTTIANGPHVYATADGGYFIAGDVFRVAPGNIVNLTEEDKNSDRAAAVASVEAKDMVVFSPEGEVKQVLYVFTDVDCGYCQTMHKQMDEYNAMGIEIRYLAFPRAGVQSQTYNKMASAWCADNPQDAITKLKLRQSVPDNVCEGNPIADQWGLGRTIGISGTPAIVLESGELIAGYLEPVRLKQRLGL